MSDLSLIFNLGKDFPRISSGIFNLDRDALITGHYGGSVIYWKSISNNPSPEIICKLNGEITDIDYFNEEEIIICTNEGELSLFNIVKKKFQLIESAKYDKYHRKFRVLKISNESFLSSGTYGKLFHWKKKGTIWYKKNIYNTTHTAFGLTKLGDKLVASGDYKGKVSIWDIEKSMITSQQFLYVGYNIKQVKFFNENTLVVLGRNGNFSYLERDNKESDFSVIKDFNILFGLAEDITFSTDGKYIVAGLNSLLMIYNLEKEIIQRIAESHIKRIFPYKNGVYILTRNSFKFIDLTKDYLEVEKIEFKYQKISLLGESGVGKSSLCNLLTGSNETEIHSTIGKKTWRWDIEKAQDDDFSRKIFLQDLGGQETTLATSLHYTLNSDLILILFKQTKEETYRKAIEIIEEINESKPGLNLFLIQTFTDHKNNDVEFINFELELKKYSVDEYDHCTSNDSDSIGNVKDKILNFFDWDKAKLIVQSKALVDIINLLDDLKLAKNIPSIDFKDFKVLLSKDIKVTTPHLKYLLEFLNDQGIIEYFPNILNKIILNEEDYELLKTRIPRWAKSKNGIFNYDELINQFSENSEIKEKYIEIIDQIYQNYEYNIKIGNKRIFPSSIYLKENPVDTNQEYEFDPEKKVIWEIEASKFPLMKFLQHLQQNRYLCKDISQNTGLFYLIDKLGYVYFNIKTKGETDIFHTMRKNICFELYYQGKNDLIQKKILKKIDEILEILFQDKVRLVERPSILNKENIL